MSWEERMAAKAKKHRDTGIEAEFGYLKVDEPWLFDINHPKNADHCRDCTEFRLFNPAAPWLGSGWMQTCGFPCKLNHAHHEGEVWFAAVG